MQNNTKIDKKIIHEFLVRSDPKNKYERFLSWRVASDPINRLEGSCPWNLYPLKAN